MAQMFCEVCFKPNPSAFTDCGQLACTTCYDSRSPERCPVCDNQQANVIAVAKVNQMAPHLSSLFKPLAPQLDTAKKVHEEATALIAEVCQVSKVNALSWALPFRSDCSALPNYCAREQFQNEHYKEVAQAVQVRCDTETQRLEQEKIELMKELRSTILLKTAASAKRETDTRFCFVALCRSHYQQLSESATQPRTAAASPRQPRGSRRRSAVLMSC